MQDASDRLAVGPLYAIAGGTAGVFGLGLLEGWSVWKGGNSSSGMEKYRFVVRYGLSQILPSLVRLTQPAPAVAESMGIAASNVWGGSDVPSRKVLLLNRLLTLRASIAGTVVLSQVVALTSVLGNTQQNYGNQIARGKEPPLADPTQQGVVLRLAGQASDVTQLTMYRQGRRAIFPIFEEPHHPMVQDLVQKYGCVRTTNHNQTNTQQHYSPINPTKKEPFQQQQPHHQMPASVSWLTYGWVLFLKNKNQTGQTDTPQVPVFWQVDSGRYSFASSWHGMYIPPNWLFETNNKKKEKLLVVEADVSPDDDGVWSLGPPKQDDDDDDDLDLYEVAQGFTRIASMVPATARVLRVLLIDTSTTVESGSGSQRSSTIRQHVNELGLADIVVDCRAPLVLTLTKWLQQKQQQKGRRGSFGWWGSSSSSSSSLRPVVLETPDKEWFGSLSRELRKHGYEVLDHYQAQRRYGTLEGIPFLVYQRTTADTLHTVRQYVGRKVVRDPTLVCALCPQHTPLLEDTGEPMEGVTHLSSTDLYDKLLRWVRQQALDGYNNQEIQSKLDQQLPEILEQLDK